MSRRLTLLRTLVSHASGSDHTKEVDWHAKWEQEMGNSEWKTGRSDATEVALTERCPARTLSDQETPFSSTPL